MQQKLTQKIIGQHLGLSQAAVSVWLQRLGLTPDDGLDRIRLCYIQALRSQAGNQGVEDERHRLLTTRRQLAELTYQRALGQVVDTAEVARERYTTARLVADGLLRLPARLAPLVSPQDHLRAERLLDREIRRVLEALADDLDQCEGAAEAEGAA